VIPAFVIGLREGLEAALIVGIIAAFLARSGRRDALRPMWIGVLAAIGICLAVGLGLQLADEALPQRQQEGLETVIALVAAGAVTWMIVWCRRNGPRMKSMIETDAADALANGSTIALVAMAFFAVLREGLETAVFLVAVFQQSERPAALGTGAMLGIAVAAVLGYAIYRGGVRINLARFFRITGALLVLVAAGLVSSAVHTAHEAGWFNSLQGRALDLTAVIEPGSVLQALVTGMFGIQTQPTSGEVLAWLLYAIPMMAYVLWPSGRQLRTRATAASAATLTLVPLIAAGCGSGSGGGGGDGKVTAVSVTNQGCQPPHLKVAAGDVTFKVTNDGADQVTEYEILDGDHILGEVENLPDGLTKSFSLTLDPGTFTTYCPGADNEKGTLEVGGTAQAAASVADKQAVNRYRDYLVAQTALLVKRTHQFRDAIAAGDIERAKQLYPTTREPYERVEPVAESFGNLDPLMDARAGDVPASKWEGFHRLEKMLWVDNTTEGATPIADRLVANTLRLQGLVQSVPLQTAQIANGAKSLLDEVAASKITGEEDRYSHTDLWDFRANVDGAKAAIVAVTPILARSDPQLLAQIRQRFTQVDSSLDPYRSGSGYVLYTKLNDADTRKLSESIDALAQPISEVAPAVLR
jgi:high-affinity iron transporter